ncbi:hypothetical protein K466DRAFT_77243 [Polyporus arcularius HHB13444]|uniref:Uncharacterized protein n=1 Tax=Polyporus arcularius HHB13444 TaxID=1314778 RepID=A0A5C3NLU1_9APHY|nr:hypothetical protein K466DRAFT_77243 [Polyporus arcularius HHB13444]
MGVWVFIYDLRMAICDSRLATCDLRLATCDLRLVAGVECVLGVLCVYIPLFLSPLVLRLCCLWLRLTRRLSGAGEGEQQASAVGWRA